ncbi:methyltransferase domain-containing protein [Aeromonas enteropelogenes]|uniref:methyltransferase domain-containing protein n=1 Tax=Aeromonas enteropelogenes TaxID=29489 RepID=UPI003BA2FBB5
MKKVDEIYIHNPAGEPRKSHQRRLKSGMIDRYLSKPLILDIGSGLGPAVTPWAKIIDLDTPGYNGFNLPFENDSVDAIFSSHCLEHVISPVDSLREWFKKIKVGGFLFIAVPHQFLYEKRLTLPSTWNGDHKRFYTPSTLLSDIERSLLPNSYRIRELREVDDGFDYKLAPNQHSQGCYEIEIVIEKINKNYDLDFSFSALERALELDNVRSVVICGAGEIGKEIGKTLLSKGYVIDMFTDKNMQSPLMEIHGKFIPICKLEDALALGKNTFVIASRLFKDQIKKELNALIKEKTINIYTI